MDDIKILLVDDEEDFIRALSERLEIRDLKSNTAFDCEQAIRILNDMGPDIMILDLKMPGIDGMEVLRRIKKSCPNIKVIIHTGHVNDLDEAEARELGVFDYLRKPVDVELLVERIRAAAKTMKQKDSMAAAAFAEAGEYDMARKIMRD